MADAKMCDRCGKFYMPYPVSLQVMDFNTHPYPPKKVDLCMNCETAVYSFLKGEENNG